MDQQETIDDIVDEIEAQLDYEKLNQSSFHIFLLDLITKVINVVELLRKEESGAVKKYIVIKIGEKVVEKHFPAFIDYYRENVGVMIELIIESFYMLKDSKIHHKLTDCCFPCIKKKKSKTKKGV